MQRASCCDRLDGATLRNSPPSLTATGDEPALPGRHSGVRSPEGSLVCACAAPAASLPVAVQVRQNVPALANSPALDELSDEPSPKGRSVALMLVVSGHVQTVPPAELELSHATPVPVARTRSAPGILGRTGATPKVRRRSSPPTPASPSTWTAGGANYVLDGRAALTLVFADLNRYEATTHVNGQTTVTIDGDRATGESYTIAHHLFSEAIARSSLPRSDTLTLSPRLTVVGTSPSVSSFSTGARHGVSIPGT